MTNCNNTMLNGIEHYLAHKYDWHIQQSTNTIHITLNHISTCLLCDHTETKPVLEATHEYGFTYLKIHAYNKTTNNTIQTLKNIISATQKTNSPIKMIPNPDIPKLKHIEGFTPTNTPYITTQTEYDTRWYQPYPQNTGSMSECENTRERESECMGECDCLEEREHVGECECMGERERVGESEYLERRETEGCETKGHESMGERECSVYVFVYRVTLFLSPLCFWCLLLYIVVHSYICLDS